MLEKTALLGLHHDGLDDDTRPVIKRRIERRGYNVTLVETLDEMLKHMGVNSKQDIMPINKFELYYMDLNLGSPWGPSYEPAALVFGYVKPFWERGDCKFLAVSSQAETVDAARAEGIPCAGKTEFKKIDDFFGPIPTQ